MALTRGDREHTSQSQPLLSQTTLGQTTRGQARYLERVYQGGTVPQPLGKKSGAFLFGLRSPYIIELSRALSDSDCHTHTHTHKLHCISNTQRHLPCDPRSSIIIYFWTRDRAASIVRGSRAFLNCAFVGTSLRVCSLPCYRSSAPLHRRKEVFLKGFALLLVKG